MFSLASHHTFALPSFAHDCLPLTESSTLSACLGDKHPDEILILGEGSNTIFVEDYPGTIVRPLFKGIKNSQNDTHHLLEVGAGENWHKLVVWCMQYNIHGLENLALIPGSVGAAPIQNIGAYGVEIEKFISKINCYDLSNRCYQSLDAKECAFGYRDSIFKQSLADNVIITSVLFAIPKRWQAVADYGELKALDECSAINIFNKVIEIRQNKLPDPTKIGNAGSFFKNPIITASQYQTLLHHYPDIPHYSMGSNEVKIPAAWLIDHLGFKGYKMGGIACHAKQALVLTNDGSGTGEQLLELARNIKAKVFSEFSIMLENEVRLIGQQGLVML